MNAERLLQHFEEISEAPDAVPRLRRFILDLAVRGKLVEQDSKEEPAPILMAQVKEEIQALRGSGALKKARQIPDVSEDDCPFTLPQGWEWERFATVAAIQSNLVQPQGYPNHPHIAPDNIESRTGRLLPYQTVAESKVRSGKHLFFPDHIIYSKIRPNLAKAAIVDFEGLCSADAYPIRSFVDIQYFLKYMLSDVFVEQSVEEANRVAMPKINQDALSKILVPVPPLAEQHRIVANVDELMALCDELEAAQTTREKRRDRLVATTLHRLNNGDTEPESEATFRQTASFYFNHLPRLTTKPEHIQQLRQTILNLAVRGKLVKQLPSEGKAETPPPIDKGRRWCIEDIELPELPSIPDTWFWYPLGHLIEEMFGGVSTKKSDYVNNGVPVFNKGNVSVLGRTLFGPNRNFVSDDFFRIHGGRAVLPGDMVVALRDFSTKADFLGLIGEYRLHEPALLSQGACVIRCYGGIHQRYLMFFSNCSLYRTIVKANKIGTTQVHLRNGQFGAIPTPVPPLAEQHRILLKVDELMALCNQLDSQLTGASTIGHQLLEATINETLTGGKCLLGVGS